MRFADILAFLLLMIDVLAGNLTRRGNVRVVDMTELVVAVRVLRATETSPVVAARVEERAGRSREDRYVREDSREEVVALAFEQPSPIENEVTHYRSPARTTDAS